MNPNPEQSSADRTKSAIETIVAAQLKKQFAKRGVQFRSTYTQKNADEFQHYFDEVLELQKDVCVPYVEYFQITPQTLYKKLIDSIRFLMEQGDDEEIKQKYCILRSRISFQYSDKPDEGIWIKFKSSPTKPRGHVVETLDRASWKEALFHWVEAGCVGVFDIDGLNLSVDDKSMVENLVEDTNQNRTSVDKLVCRVTLTSIRIMP